MRKKAQMVEQIRRALIQAGWQSVRVRQLYHDRDEVTVSAHR
jgi:23S rRNA (cytidine2498-2'-O)-methyltransferase